MADEIVRTSQERESQQQNSVLEKFENVELFLKRQRLTASLPGSPKPATDGILHII